VKRLIFLLLLFVSSCSAQLTVSLPGPGPIHTVATQFPGWTWRIDAYSGSNLTTSGGCTNATKCTITFGDSVTTSSTRSAWAVAILTTNNVSISRVCKTTQPARRAMTTGRPREPITSTPRLATWIWRTTSMERLAVVRLRPLCLEIQARRSF